MAKPEMDATEYLMSSPANRERLPKSIQHFRDGMPLIIKTTAELEAMQKRTERKESSNDR
jgi:hypothetical protein